MQDVTDLIKCVRGGGKFIQVGLPAADLQLKFDILDLVTKQKSIVGSLVGSRNDVRKMLDFSAFHNIQPIVENYEWKDFPKAYNRLLNERPRFRCVVDVDTYQE